MFYSAHYILFFFFFNDTATTEIYTLSLHDALPISARNAGGRGPAAARARPRAAPDRGLGRPGRHQVAGAGGARRGPAREVAARAGESDLQKARRRRRGRRGR